MKNNFSSPHGLPYFADLLKVRESQINSLINNLKVDDVKDDGKFQNTASRIKKAIIPSPIVIGEGKFVDHEYEEIPLTFQQQVSGGNKNHFHHEISFPFTGSNELLKHRPNNYSYSTSDRGVIMPGSSALTVYVDLPELNPDKAVMQARTFLSMTIQFATENNTTLKSWADLIEKQIDDQLGKKRNQLIKLFGGK